MCIKEKESCTCHNKNIISEEGLGKPSHKVHNPRITLETGDLPLVSATHGIEYAIFMVSQF